MEQSLADSQKHEASCRRLAVLCWILFVAALAMSLVRLYASMDHAPVAAAVEVSPGEAHAGSAESGAGSHALVTHGTKSISEAVFQLAAVLLMCGLWFAVFVHKVQRERIRERNPVTGGASERPWCWLSPPLKPVQLKWLDAWGLPCLSALPALAFALAMRSEYVPAVFLMALVAIFIAAEHYGGLIENKEVLSQTTQHLGDMLSEHQRQLGRLLNADGLDRWKADVYDRYLAAESRIDAVVRIWDIDQAWWQIASSDDIWQKYQEAEEITLFRALTTVSPAKAPRTDAVQFVGDMPWPIDYMSSHGQPASKVGGPVDNFNRLIGLTWRLVVLGLVRAEREKRHAGIQPYLRVRIASCPAWMHAVDDTVFQVLERREMSESAVRELTLEIQEGSHRKRLCEWAHQDIRRHARRGSSAEEYVCAVFRWVALYQTQLNEDAGLDPTTIKRVLVDMGMSEWLAADDKSLRMQPGDRRHAEQMCVSVFIKFFSQRMQASACSVTHAPSGPMLLSHLLVEVV